MNSNRSYKDSLLLLMVVGLVSIVVFVGIGEGGVTADYQAQSENLPSGWTVECIDCLRYFSQMSGNSAALDSSGLIHTAYGGDGLYYAVQNPDDTYTTEVVDANPERGLNATMVLDSNDRPHILYYAGDLLRLNYAYFDGASWQINSLPTGDLTALPHPWLVIDGNDELHVAFIEGDNLVYGFYSLSSWVFSVVDTDAGGDIGRPSLALNSYNQPHIAYGRGGKYASFRGDYWQITTFAGTHDEGESIALAFDQEDYPHIIYQTNYDGYDGLDVRYRHFDGQTWQNDYVDNGDLVLIVETGFDISLIINEENELIVSYTVQFFSPAYPTEYYYVLRLARLESTSPIGWERFDLYCCPGAYYDKNYVTLLAGDNDELLLVHKYSQDLITAVFTAQGFVTTYIDQGGVSGTHIDLAVDHDDRLHVVAHEFENDRLRYGLKDNGSWSVETLTGDAGWFGDDWLSLAVTSDNRPYVMYDRYSRFGRLFFLYFDGQAWQSLQYEYHLARTFDIEMDSANNLHVGLYNYFGDNVYHFTIDPAGTMSEMEFVDPRFTRGELDMALDSADFGHIVFPSNNDGMRYAVQTPSGWLSETVVPDRVDYPSIAIDRYDKPHIAWYDVVDADLRYGYYDGSNWQITTLDSNGDVGQFASMAVDRIGRIYIAYYDATNGDLKYATYDGNSWSIETLLSDGDVGSFSKLVMPYAGYPAIAYYDAVARDLMMIYRPFQPTHFLYHPIVRGANP